MKTTKTTTKTKKITKRGYIKQLLNRKTVYRVSDYVRKLRKVLGREYTEKEVLYTLIRMEREGQLIHVVEGTKIRGILTA